MNQGPVVPQALRVLKSANLRIEDFIIDKDTMVTTDRRIFFSGTWNNEHNVTICLAFDVGSHVFLSRSNEFCLTPIVEFIDEPPKEIIDLLPFAVKKHTEGIFFFDHRD